MGIREAARAATRAARATHGREVIYRRGNLSASLIAIEGRTDAAADSQHGAIILDRVKDWIVERADLELGGELVEPQPGDAVEVVDGETRWRYEVQELSSGVCYRFSGPGRERFRIHTRFAGEAE